MSATHAAAPQSLSGEALSPAQRSKAALWTGRVLNGIAVLFLLFDTSLKIFANPEAVKGTAELGFPSYALLTIGVIELICLVAFLIPRTAVLGAILWTGYLGGAIATHLRMNSPLLTHTLFPIYVAVLIWGGLALRDRRVLACLKP